jgi:hypothetical protein
MIAMWIMMGDLAKAPALDKIQGVFIVLFRASAEDGNTSL